MLLINALHSRHDSYLEHLDLIVDDPQAREAAKTDSPAQMLLQYKARTYDIIHSGYNILNVRHS